MDDSLVRARAVRAQGSSLRALIDSPAVDAEQETAPAGVLALDELHPLPLPGDPYVAFSRASNKPTLSLRFLLADATIKGFSYVNLDSFDLAESGTAGGGPVIVLRFTGIAVTEVRIEGRHLMALYDKIGHHRIAWVRELPKERDFREEGATVINRIDFLNTNF